MAMQNPASMFSLYMMHTISHHSLSLDNVGFTRPVVTRLIKLLESRPVPNLSPNEQAHLTVLIQTTLEVSEQHSQKIIIKCLHDLLDRRTEKSSGCQWAALPYLNAFFLYYQ